MLYIYIYIYIYIYRCFPLHLLFIFVTGPSLHCLEGNSLECSIRLLSATHHALFFDLHPSMPDGVHGPFFVFLKKDVTFVTLSHIHWLPGANVMTFIDFDSVNSN